MIGVHRLSDDQFGALAAGHGGAGTVRALREARLSRHLLLIKYIVEDRPEHRAALAVLGEAQRRAPDRFADLLSYPLIGAWAGQTVRRLRGSVTSSVPLQAQLGHLDAIAVAAAVHAGLDADLTGYVHGGAVVLPTLGRTLVPLPDFAPVRLAVRNRKLTIRYGQTTIAEVADPNADNGCWQVLRRLTVETDAARLTVMLDDVDPYRGGHHAPAADRVSNVGEWRDTLAPAWQLLVNCMPVRAEELRAGLRALVPLVQIDPGSARSATIRDAFGAFGLTLPASPADLAVTLVHEFQHSKLSALLDLVPLFDGSASDTYFAPWRQDPRPVGALMQGVYAFLGVCDTWRSLRRYPNLHGVATRELAELREQVDHALTDLSRSGQLTAAGRRFAAGMRSTMDELMAEPVPADTVELAREALAAKLAAWRDRHGTPTQAQ